MVLGDDLEEQDRVEREKLKQQAATIEKLAWYKREILRVSEEKSRFVCAEWRGILGRTKE